MFLGNGNSMHWPFADLDIFFAMLVSMLIWNILGMSQGFVGPFELLGLDSSQWCVQEFGVGYCPQVNRVSFWLKVKNLCDPDNNIEITRMLGPYLLQTMTSEQLALHVVGPYLGLRLRTSISTVHWLWCSVDSILGSFHCYQPRFCFVF